MGHKTWTNISIIGVPEGEEREKEVESLLEEMISENFPNLEKGTDFQIQVAPRFQRR